MQHSIENWASIKCSMRKRIVFLLKKTTLIQVLFLQKVRGWSIKRKYPNKRLKVKAKPLRFYQKKRANELVLVLFDELPY